MTIVSRGYEGQIMPNVEWAEWQQGAGHEYVASHYDAGRVTVVTSTPLTVRVNPGPTVDGLRTGIGGGGVYDIITAPEDITITDALPGAGQSKWYTTVAHRTWQTTQATTFTMLTGTSTPAIAASRQKTPGEVDDQPLALVQVTNGTSGLSITAVIDLRPVSRQQGEYIIAKPGARDLVMSYMNKVGYTLRVGGVEWGRVLSSGAPVWTPVGGATPRVNVSLEPLVVHYPGRELACYRVGDEVVLAGGVVTTGAGDFSPSLFKVGQLPAGSTPDRVHNSLGSAVNGVYNVWVEITPAGAIYLKPATSIPAAPAGAINFELDTRFRVAAA